eukprot:TRINITY_DN1086_c1_g1_i6.p4 TRINITY_DN1086_c1_g1~~TRINITY_DN1086_c1_g1_i6.p4  ORF type:complete len:146 (-),score=55.70 TRINITY_DN1086_c1_g1_i6:275-712(-)
MAKALLSNWNVRCDDSCVAHYAAAAEEWRCFHSQYCYSFVDHPLFSHEFQMDSANLNYDGVSYPFNQNTLPFAEQLQKTMLAVTANVSGLFLPSCVRHEVEDSDAFSSFYIDGVNNAAAIGQWFFEGVASRHVDSCAGVNCNKNC